MTAAPPPLGVDTTDRVPVGDGKAYGTPAPTPTRTERTWFLAVPFAIAMVLAFAHTPDDGLITLRYAWHLVHGQGPVFNPGEHVAGSSSMLHLLVSTVVVLAPHTWALVVAKLVSAVFGALALWQGARLVAAAALPRWARRTGYLLLSCSSMLALSSANALETTMYVFLVTLLVRLLVAGRAAQTPVVVGTVAALVVMTRPDGALVVGALALAALVLERGVSRGAAVKWALGGVAGGATVLGATFAFTGDPFPNTFYAKRVPLDRGLREGWRYLQQTLLPGLAEHGSRGLVSGLLFLAYVAFLVTGAVVLVRGRSRSHGRVAYTVALVVAQVAFVLESGGDWMRGGRFLVPALAASVVVTLTGVVAAAERAARRAPDLRRVAVMGGAGILLAVTLAPWASQSVPIWRISGTPDDDAFLAVGGYQQYTAAWMTIPKVLSCFPGARAATSEVGNTGWADPRRPVLDLRGLTDDVIAHDAPDSSRRVVGVALGDWWKPGSVVARRIVAWRADVVLLLGDEADMPGSVYGGGYVKRATLPLGYDDHLVVYTRPGLPDSCAERGVSG